MKKTLFLFLALMMMGINSATAQSHIGKWIAGQEFRKLINDDPNMSIDLGLVFTAKDINIQLIIESVHEELTMNLMYTIPGTYTKSGKNVTSKFTPEKAALKVIDLKFNDPESNKLLEDKDMKAYIYSMIEEQANAGIMKDETVKEFIDMFRNFTIEKVTASMITLGVNGAMVSFDRKK